MLPHSKKEDDDYFKDQDRYCYYGIVALSSYLLLLEIPLIVQLKIEWFLHLSSVVNAIADVLLIYNNFYRAMDS